jgi:hypothetical protein
MKRLVGRVQFLHGGLMIALQSKPQKHKMVHIEVWLGEGTRTVGARHQTGVVQVCVHVRVAVIFPCHHD